MQVIAYWSFVQSKWCITGIIGDTGHRFLSDSQRICLQSDLIHRSNMDVIDLIVSTFRTENKVTFLPCLEL